VCVYVQNDGAHHLAVPMCQSMYTPTQANVTYLRTRRRGGTRTQA